MLTSMGSVAAQSQTAVGWPDVRAVMLGFLITTLTAFSGLARATEIVVKPAAQDSVQQLQHYVQLNTSNPPGNEYLGARFFADIFQQQGIDYEIIETAPGRANIVARLKGGSEPALLLLHHMDVVAADAKRWRYPAFGAIVADGYLYGRGTLDNKSAGIFHLRAFLDLHRSGKPLIRDVVFLAAADEEAGGSLGVGWLWQHRPDIFAGIGAVLNEGGSGDIRNDKLSFGIEVTQKLPLWLKISAKGEPGHGAVPHRDSAPQRLLRALVEVQGFHFAPHLTPVVTNYLRAMAAVAPRPWRARLKDPEQLVTNNEWLAALQDWDHRLYAQLTNTCVVTRLRGSDKINVVPPEASAELDCRLLPDQDPQQVVDALRSVVATHQASIEVLLSFRPGSSSADNFLYRGIERLMNEKYPEAAVLAKMNAGFTDSHYFRQRGIPAYGFTPVLLSKDESAGVHGDNERISIRNIVDGEALVTQLVSELVYSAGAR